MNGRDETVGRALLELEVPEHAPGFFEELETLLAREAKPPRRRRWPVGAGALATAVAAVAVALAVVWTRPEPADAAAIAREAGQTLTDLRSLSGRATYRALDPQTGALVPSRFSFARTAAGDVRVTRLSPTFGDLAYDASQGVVTSSETSASLGTGRFYAERSWAAPGPPDEPPLDAVVGRELGAAVRALAAARDPEVTEAEVGGKPAWRLEADVRPNAIFADADHLSVLVDRATMVPVRVVATLGGAPRSDLRVELKSVDTALPAALFAVPFPAGSEVQRFSSGFRRVDLGAVEAAVGYPPLVPQRLPAGYELREVAVADAAEATAGGANPPSRKVVSLSYRRGLEQVVVTTRLRGAGDWRDPFSVAGVDTDERPVSGVPGAADARVVVGPRSLPHLWALTDRLVVTVAGDLTEPELVAVARSLR
jgi:hypothetical protein